MVDYKEYVDGLNRQSFMDMIDVLDERKENERREYKSQQARNMVVNHQKLMNCVDYMITHKCSTKEAAKKFETKPDALYKYINNDLKKLDSEKYVLAKAVQNMHQSNYRPERAERAIIVADYMLNYNTSVRETAEALALTEKQVYRDLTVVLPEVDEEKYCKIKNLMENRRKDKKIVKEDIMCDLSNAAMEKKSKRAVEIADYIIKNRVSIEKVSQIFNLPTFIIVDELEISLPRSDKDRYTKVKQILDLI